MKLTVLKTEEDYEVALRHIEMLMDAEPGSLEEEKLDRLASLIEEYEDIHYPIEPPEPGEMELFWQDQMNRTLSCHS